MDLPTAGKLADELINAEVAIQDRMWGTANERADALNNQMSKAAAASLAFTIMREDGTPEDRALDAALTAFYPKDWNGFRSYGSTVANLVVAAAFIRSEIKRRIAAGEDITRTKRGEPYKGPDLPYMSSEEAASL